MGRSSNRRACNIANRALDVAGKLREVLGVSSTQLLRTDELAREFRFPTPEAVRQYLRRHQVPYLTRGRVVLVDRRDFEASMSKARKDRLRGAA